MSTEPVAGKAPAAIDPTGSPSDGQALLRRSPRRKVLRGTVEVHHSTRLRFPRLHVEADCAGLEKTPADTRTRSRFASAADLANVTDGRPCRMCTLEPLLRTLLTGSAPDRALVTFSSQPNPLSGDTSPFSFSWNAVTPSGEARLVRLARAARLEVLQTGVCGKVAFGFVPTTAVQALIRNLRCHVLDLSPALPEADTVETFWALVSDAPPQLDEALGQLPRLEHWQTAQALSIAARG